MPRKTQVRKGKRGTRRMRRSHKSKSMRSTRKSYKYRSRGGCENGTCLTESTTPQWISKGGDGETINKDINSYVNDKIFYSQSN